MIASVLGVASVAGVIVGTVGASGADAAVHVVVPANSTLSRQLGPYGTVYGNEYDKYGKVVGTIFQAYCAGTGDIAIGLQFAAGSASASVVSSRPVTSSNGHQGWAVTIARSAPVGPPRAVCLVGV